jgi:lipoate-protein ligase A
MDSLRLLIDLPLEGVANMARDEALLEGVEAGHSPPTLRLYAWREPTLSLGYFQKSSEVAAQSDRLRALPVVRRLTGGGAILHDLEVTYCLALPTSHALLNEGSTHLYELAHAAVVALAREQGINAATGECATIGCGNAQRGPFLCFSRHHPLDVLVAGRKLAGSAQRRTRGGLIQHGSLILASRFAEQECAVLDPQQKQPYAHWAKAFAGAWSAQSVVGLHPGEWSAQELTSADQLCGRYRDSAWTMQR